MGPLLSAAQAGDPTYTTHEVHREGTTCQQADLRQDLAEFGVDPKYLWVLTSDDLPTDN